MKEMGCGDDDSEKVDKKGMLAQNREKERNLKLKLT
jgi:hypothetical protein